MTPQECLDWYSDMLELLKKYEYHFTNADRIRCMTDEELGEWLLKNAACPCAAMNGGCALNDDTCRQAWLDWLKEEVKE